MWNIISSKHTSIKAHINTYFPTTNWQQWVLLFTANTCFNASNHWIAKTSRSMIIYIHQCALMHVHMHIHMYRSVCAFPSQVYNIRTREITALSTAHQIATQPYTAPYHSLYVCVHLRVFTCVSVNGIPTQLSLPWLSSFSERLLAFAACCHGWERMQGFL